MSSKVRTSATSRVKFTPQQDKILIELAANKPYPNWPEIAEHVPGKTALQCRERYKHYLAPNIVSGSWTSTEDTLLYELYQEFPNDWARITSRLPGRTNSSVKNRFHSSDFQRRTVSVTLEPTTEPIVDRNESLNEEDLSGEWGDFDELFDENL
jgi:hypothetical protein